MHVCRCSKKTNVALFFIEVKKTFILDYSPDVYHTWPWTWIDVTDFNTSANWTPDGGRVIYSPAETNPSSQVRFIVKYAPNSWSNKLIKPQLKVINTTNIGRKQILLEEFEFCPN